MIHQFAAVALVLAFALGAGCNQSAGNNGTQAVANTMPAAAPAPAASASSAAPGDQPEAPTARAKVVVLDPEGLRTVDPQSGSTQLIAFGSPADQAVETLSRLFGGRPTQDGVNEECGGGPARIVQWANGMGIVAEEGRFTGWQVDKGGVTAINGIGVGATRTALDEALKPSVQESTLGTEFTIAEGDISWGGILSGPGRNATIEAIWAGSTCHFR